jgi:hypothetical protein
MWEGKEKGGREGWAVWMWRGGGLGCMNVEGFDFLWGRGCLFAVSFGLIKGRNQAETMRDLRRVILLWMLLLVACFAREGR